MEKEVYLFESIGRLKNIVPDLYVLFFIVIFIDTFSYCCLPIKPKLI